VGGVARLPAAPDVDPTSPKGPFFEAARWCRSFVSSCPFPLNTRLVDELAPAHTFITEYPDFARDQYGNLCTRSDSPLPNFSTGTWGWLELTDKELNAAVDATGAYGWAPVTGIPEAFLDHGYCAGSSSDFVTVAEAIANFNIPGAFHPNAAGQNINFTYTQPAVCTALYTNPECSGTPRPPSGGAP